jgi:bifunctional N-acetylglucosamine-1-phosphate-uridyltransferase/glucosamine-1-phosphate-acetyltransferase GlmU-like protein
MYKSLGTKAYKIGKALGMKAFQVGPSLGSKVNPVSYLGNMAVKKAIDIGAHKELNLFTPTGRKNIK